MFERNSTCPYKNVKDNLDQIHHFSYYIMLIQITPSSLLDPHEHFETLDNFKRFNVLGLNEKQTNL